MGDFEALMRSLLGNETTAIDWDKSFLRDRGLASRALLIGSSLDLQPLVDAGPAVEVATEGDNGFRHRVQADAAVEAATHRRKRSIHTALL